MTKINKPVSKFQFTINICPTRAFNIKSFVLRVEKLKNVIRKTFGKFGKLVNEHYPVDEEGKTKGMFWCLYFDLFIVQVTLKVDIRKYHFVTDSDFSYHILKPNQ